MAQIFHPSINTLSKGSIFGAVLFVAALAWAGFEIAESPYLTGARAITPQPVPFSHKHHVSGLGIDCRYCHVFVEESAVAGLPPTETCMNCHSQIWADSPMLEPVRDSFRTGRSIEWARVHDLPDFVYFDHSIHVANGIGCVSCHGRVDEMPLMWQQHTLQMNWCLSCHRGPEPHLRPRAEVFVMDGEPAERPDAPARRYDAAAIRRLTTCSACHR